MFHTTAGRLALPAWSILLCYCNMSAEPFRSFRVGTFNARELSALASASRQYKAARIVELMDADVVLLEEVAGRAALDALASQAPIRGHYSYRLARVGNDERGFGLALLSKWPPSWVRSHREDRFRLRGDEAGTAYRYARDCLEVHFKLGPHRLALLGVHFRSQVADDPEHRLAEAQHTRDIVDQLLERDPELKLLVLGDLNSTPGSAAWQTLVGISSQSGRGPMLTDATQGLPPSERWTWEAFGKKPDGQLLDGMLANPNLASFLVPGSVAILHDDDLPSGLGEVSDHAPLAATFAQ
ncbi:endonuclease/exonuclease/phosphatase family protein [Myxococcota bacterium]